MLRPESVVEIVIPSIAGASSSPASVGVAPVSVWSTYGTNTVTEKRAAFAR